MAQTYESDPVQTLINANQHIILNDSINTTKIQEEITTKRGVNGLFNKATIEAKLIDWTPMNSMVLNIPITLTWYHVANKSSVVENWAAWFYSCLGVLDTIYRLDIKFNNANIIKEESNLMRNMKLVAQSYKLTDDDARIMGSMGLLSTFTYNSLATNPDAQLAINNLPFPYNPLVERNPPLLRQSYFELLQQLTANGTTSATSAITVYQQDYFPTTAKINIAVPLKYLYKVFQTDAMLPPGLTVQLDIQTYIPEVSFGCKITPTFGSNNPGQGDGGWLSSYLNPTDGGLKLYYAYNRMNPDIDAAITKFRMGLNDLKYGSDLWEEFILEGNGPTWMTMITTQQQYPTAISIRFLAVNTAAEFDGTFVGVVPNVNALAIRSTGGCFFKDSICSPNLYPAPPAATQFINNITQLQIYRAGELIYDYQTNDNLPFGTYARTAQDYIFNENMYGKSYLNMNTDFAQNPLAKNLTSANMNSPYNMILQPGGEAQVNEQPGNTNAFNLKLVIKMRTTLPDNIYISVIRSIPSITAISALNQVSQIMWPQEESNGMIKIVIPNLSN